MMKKFGTCQFCGQQIAMRGRKPIDGSTVDDIATAECDCDGAARLKEKKHKKEKVNDLRSFAESLKDNYERETIELLLKGIDAVEAMQLKSITVNATIGTVLIIKAGAKGTIYLEEKVTTSKKQEV
ncbi:MAG: hypothetical protein ACRCUS_08925 [Anaerovoracaceae bacterium]